MRGSLDWIREKIRGKVQASKTSDNYVWVKDIFPFSQTAVVEIEDYSIEKAVEMYEYPWSLNATGDDVDLGQPTAVDLAYVYKRRAEEAAKGEGAELTGPIVKKDAKERIVYAAVLVPGEPDRDFERGEKILSAEEIERVAHGWMENYQNVDLMHTLNNTAVPIESYILPGDMEVEFGGKSHILPKGTWVLASKVQDEKVWDQVEKGKLTGYSVMGMRKTALKAAEKKEDVTASLKRTLLKDLGDDWIAPFVSIVDEPCVPKAKFFAIKQAPEADPGEQSPTWIAKLKSLFGGGEEPAVKEGRRFSETTYSNLKAAVEALGALIKEAEEERKFKGKKSGSGKAAPKEGDDEVTKEEMQAIMQEAVKSALEPIDARISAIEKATKSAEPGEGQDSAGEGAEGAAKGAEGADTGDDPSKEVLKRLEDIEKRLGKAAPKSLAGQDGEGEPAQKGVADYGDRDTYGRKRAAK